MGFAVVNILGLKSLLAIPPLFIMYGGVAIVAIAQWVLTRKRPVLLLVASTLAGVCGHFIGRYTHECPAHPATIEVPMVEELIADAAERVDRQKEDLAHYIDQNLPNIPELLHANCREFEDALAARGLLCVDVGPDSAWHAKTTDDARGYRLWAEYRAARADFERLTER